MKKEHIAPLLSLLLVAFALLTGSWSAAIIAIVIAFVELSDLGKKHKEKLAAEESAK